MRKVKKLSKAEMARVGVDLVDVNRVLLSCKKCNTTWSPNLLEGGKLPSKYWHCPNGCNNKGNCHVD